ncbi:hypothetical protein LLG96_09730 [bacterium]|nr:hypothetical protein [bacterium]
MTPLQRDRFALAGAVTAVGLVYLASLRNLLVADDWVFVYPHTFAQTLAYFFKSIIPPEWQSLWLRPVPMLLFWLDSKLWPGTAWGPHLTNVLIHVVNVYLIWSIMRFMKSGTFNGSKTVIGGTPALVACLVYGLHPLSVGSVTWVGARFDVMSVTFGLLGLLLWLRRETELSGKKHTVAALLVLVAALLSKEQGIVFIMACFIVSLFGFVREKKPRRNYSGLAALILLVALYTIYRLFIFSGLGGYLTARHGLSFTIPFYFLSVVLFPFLNIMPGWTLSWTFGASAVVLTAAAALLWKTVPEDKHRMPLLYPVIAFTIFATGLATTAPHVGMTVDQILGHAESRFVLIPIVGLALLSGLFVQAFVRTRLMHRALLVIIVFMGIAGAWRSDIQIQAWRKGGLIADSIISQTIALAPDPLPGSRLIFIDIPRNTDEYTYIFGIGLAEALKYRYGRTDITVIRYPTRRDLGTAKPERDNVFQYHLSTGMLEKLTAVKKVDKK